MSYVRVLFPEIREVFIDDQSQGSNIGGSGRPRTLFVNAGLHTFRLTSVANDVQPPSQDVDVPDRPILDPYTVEFKKC